MEPKVSVVIPVYNVKKYLPACIDSLVNQTLEGIELIFVDDCSPDGSWDILQQYHDRFPEKIIAIKSDVNLRQGGARNIGIKAASAHYIGFADSDDLVLPEMFQKLYDSAVASNADVTFCKCSAIEEDFDLKKNNQLSYKPFVQWNSKLLGLQDKYLDDRDRTSLMAYEVGGVYCGLWKKNLIIDNECFFPEHVRWEDNYWAAFIKTCLQKVHFIDEVLYLYRQRQSSTIHSGDLQSVKERIMLEKKLVEKSRELQIFDRYYPALEYMYTYRYAFGTAGKIINALGTNSAAIKMMRELTDDLSKTFPQWYKNEFYLELTGKKKRFLNKLLMYHPNIWLFLYNVKNRNKK